MKTTNEIAQEATAQVFAALSDVNTSTAKVLTIITKAIEAAQVQGEPVAVFHGLVDSCEHGTFNLDILKMIPRGANLYTSPPKRQPLTAERIDEIWCSSKYGKTLQETRKNFARGIEAEINWGGA